MLTRVVRTENGNNKVETGYLYGNGADSGGGYSVRPILTLKADIKFSSGGDGKSWQNAYVLE